MQILFMGSDSFALPALQALHSGSGFEVIAVVTQPAKPVGRKQILTPTPVAMAADGLGLPVFTPEKVGELTSTGLLTELNPDLIVVAAYGQIIPGEIIDFPRLGSLNIHGSLLPTYRGAVPIEMALLNGDEETGVSILQMTAGLDDGPVLGEKVHKITPEHTAESLREELADSGAALLLELLPGYADGDLKLISQTDLAAETGRELSICKTSDVARPKLEITAADTAETAWGKVRAGRSTTAWFKTEHNGKEVEVKVYAAQIAMQFSVQAPFDALSMHKSIKNNVKKLHLVKNSKKLFLLLAENTFLELVELQLAGKKRGFARDYLYLG